MLEATLDCPRQLAWVAGKMASETTRQTAEGACLNGRGRETTAARLLRRVGPGLLAWQDGGGGGGDGQLVNVAGCR